MINTFWGIAKVVCWVWLPCYIIWILAGGTVFKPYLRPSPWERPREIWFEIKWVVVWLFTPLWTATGVNEHGDWGPEFDSVVNVGFGVYMFFIWRAMRKGKDDRWKKRRKKLAAQVKEVAGRLVVIPTPVPSPSGRISSASTRTTGIPSSQSAFGT